MARIPLAARGHFSPALFPFGPSFPSRSSSLKPLVLFFPQSFRLHFHHFHLFDSSLLPLLLHLLADRAGCCKCITRLFFRLAAALKSGSFSTGPRFLTVRFPPRIRPVRLPFCLKVRRKWAHFPHCCDSWRIDSPPVFLA